MYQHDKYYIIFGRRKTGNLNTHGFKSNINTVYAFTFKSNSFDNVTYNNNIQVKLGT